MNIERLNNLANTDFVNFIKSENNVKYKIVIPFLQAFNHVDLDLEHAAQGSRIDINIGNRIIVETKALGININIHVQQLADYCSKEGPVMAILTNGSHFRIYSPLWKKFRAFTEKIIYEFELKDLTDINLLNRLEKILDFTNYESLEFTDYIDQREKELFKIKLQIDELKLLKKSEVNEVNDEIQDFKLQIQELNEQIKLKEKLVSEMESGNIPELESLASDYFIPFLVSMPSAISRPGITASNSNTLSSLNNMNHIREKTTEQPHLRKTGNRDHSRFDVKINGQSETNLNKRQTMYFVISKSVKFGISPAKLMEQTGKSRWISIDKEVHHNTDFENEFRNGAKNYDSLRWFNSDNELIRHNGRTYAYTNQQGTETFDLVRRIFNSHIELNGEIKKSSTQHGVWR